MKNLFDIQFKARQEVDSAMLALVKDVEPMTRSMERLIIKLDEAKVIRLFLPMTVGSWQSGA